MNRSVTVVSGAGPYTAAGHWIHESRVASGQPVIALDRVENPVLTHVQNVVSRIIDLNPLAHPRGYVAFCDDLEESLRHACDQLAAPGIGLIVAAAAIYHTGQLIEISPERRRDLIGVNLSGKVELLAAALNINAKRRFKSCESTTIVDFGSLHGLIASPSRSLYAASKFGSIALCSSLLRNKEVRRCLHVAPAAIDTYMLHANHWCIKAGGPASLVDAVRSQGTTYDRIFVDCDRSAFEEACSEHSFDAAAMRHIFERYSAERRNRLQSPEGILSRSQISAFLDAMVADENIYPSGVYILRAPGGTLVHTFAPFDSCFTGLNMTPSAYHS